MIRKKRPFYIIAHNPNTIEETKEYLDLGVNALEPDIVQSDDGTYYVSHEEQSSYDDCITLQHYLSQLKSLLSSPAYDLALIIFDLKDTGMDINHLVEFVRIHFSGGKCDGVALLFTHSDDIEFLNKYKGDYPNVGVGVDETNTPPSEVQNLFNKGGQKYFTYADGITTFLTKPGVFQNITAAQECRYENEPASFSLIYTWVLNKEASMRKYLDDYIDGIFVDPPQVKNLRDIIAALPYAEAFELAKNGYNPFTAPPLPKYRLAVKTVNKFMAGTDARILFTLTGISGLSLKSLPFNGNLEGALEKGTTTYVTLEGLDIGIIKSLTVEVLTSDMNSRWLLESVTVESKLLDNAVEFIFNKENSPHDWLSNKTGPVTKELQGS